MRRRNERIDFRQSRKEDLQILKFSNSQILKFFELTRPYLAVRMPAGLPPTGITPDRARVLPSNLKIWSSCSVAA